MNYKYIELSKIENDIKKCMEPKPRIIRKRIKLRKKSFFKREVMNITYREIFIFAIFALFLLFGLFHKAIYSYFAGA
jgi:hypothetical protein